MGEISLHTHPIVTDVHEEYEFKWCGRLMDIKPDLRDGLPLFIIVGGKGRSEFYSNDIKRVERCAKALTRPRGRAARTTDIARIYVKEINGNETLVATLTHNHVKSYAPMFDKFEYY